MSGEDRQVQFTLRIPKSLREAIKEYCRRRRTNVSKLTLDYYHALLEAESIQEADQI